VNRDSICFTNFKKKRIIRAGLELNLLTLFSLVISLTFFIISFFSDVNIIVGFFVFIAVSSYSLYYYVKRLVLMTFEVDKIIFFTPLKKHEFYYNDIKEVKIDLKKLAFSIDVKIKLKNGKTKVVYAMITPGKKTNKGNLVESTIFLKDSFSKHNFNQFGKHG